MRSLSTSEVELLKSLYVQHDTPVDKFVRKRDRLIHLVSEFNRRVREVFQPDEVHAYMMKERKSGRWPRIRRQYHGRYGKRAP